MKLYTYWRSSASYRVRIALHIKKMNFESCYVNLKDSEHLNGPHAQFLPHHAVPVLVHDQLTLTQSTAIIEYIEEINPSPALLPQKAQERAGIRSFCQTIACDVHPLNNLKVLRFLDHELSVTSEQKNQWYETWVHHGFQFLEQTVKKNNSSFCFGNSPTMADCYLIPQVYNALRFNVDVQNYPSLLAVYEHCLTLEPFIMASPEKQQDCVL
jgi:maleylacetoacetate isomerase